MGMEVPETDVMPVQVQDVADDDKIFQGEVDAKPAPEEPIQFGVLGSSNPAKGNPELNHAPNANAAEVATDEWPAQPQFHSFYFVKYRSYEDPKLKADLDRADKDLQKKSQARSQMLEALKAKRAERAQIIAQLKPLSEEDRKYRAAVGEKKKEMEPLHAALGKLRTANNAVRENGVGLCSSEEELNNHIQSLNYCIQHESNTLVEEKKMLKEIKQLEGTREKVIANAAMRTKIQDSVGHKEAIQDQVKLIGVDLDGVKKDQQALRAKIKVLEEEKNTVDGDLASMSLELDAMSEKRNKAYETLTGLKKSREEVNTLYYQNRSLLNAAKELAAKKDVKALEELANSKVESFMSQWSIDKAFREDYKMRVLPSLDGRQLSRDGRMRNPDEKLIFAEPAPAVIETEPLERGGGKHAKEKASLPNDVSSKVLPTSVQVQEVPKPAEPVPKGKKNIPEPEEDDLDFVIHPKKAAEVKEVDAAKLKETKREDEIAKNKLAMERKKKLAEKAAAKAEVRNQKDAEKKQKEKEKRAKKKAEGLQAANGAPTEQEEDNDTAAEITEPEGAELAEAPAPTPAVAKVPREKARPRNTQRGQRQVPKGLLAKRKKALSYWTWAIPAAVGLVAVLAALLYYYFVAIRA